MGYQLAIKIIKVSAWSLALVNFWIFARLTVDDSFITWRYGRNLVEHGVWNYNPTTFDPTQAYTNPIYALLSIIPAALGMNVVLFFKLLSTVMVLAFIFWFLRHRPSANLPLALFFAVPATLIHVFSGLETFLYVALVFFLLVAMVTSNNRLALTVTILLFLTRPESWLLIGLVPLFLSLNFCASQKRIDWLRLVRSFLTLAIPLGTYFVVHIAIFGQALPNTFFVKSGQFFPSWNILLWMLTLLPLLFTALSGYLKVSAFAALFTGVIAFHYSTAFLSMDYAFRYAFHLLAPLMLFAIYVLSQLGVWRRLQDRLLKLLKSRTLARLTVPVLATGLALGSMNTDLIYLANTYPKLLITHGEVGFLIKKMDQEVKIRAIAVGDAGLIPYNSDLPNLDLYRLGSHIGATSGITKELINQYQVDFAVLRGFKYAESELVDSLKSRKLDLICVVDFSDEYRLHLWSKQRTPDLQKVCNASSFLAEESELSFFLKSVQLAPWTYWN